MSYISIGDMAQQFQLRQHNVQLKSTMDRISSELVTGVYEDMGEVLGGDFNALAGIERSLKTLSAYSLVTAEAELLTGSMQTALNTIQSIASEAGTTLLSAATSSSATLVDTTTQDAATKFETVIATLNSNLAGRFLFSGSSVGQKPLASGAEMLAQIKTEIAGETDVSVILGTVEAWFDGGEGDGGFIDTSYFGDAEGLGPFRVSEDQSVTVGVTAQSAEIRDVLRGFALAALVDDGLFEGDLVKRSAMTQAAGELIITGDNQLAVLQSEVGTLEGRIDDAATTNSAQTASMELALNKLMAVDQYESATALEALQTQLETLYTLTARMSGLSLVDYI